MKGIGHSTVPRESLDSDEEVGLSIKTSICYFVVVDVLTGEATQSLPGGGDDIGAWSGKTAQKG